MSDANQPPQGTQELTIFVQNLLQQMVSIINDKFLF
jgi:hypothetical protein